MTALEAALLANLLLAGVLTGNELGGFTVVHRALGTLELRANVAAERAIYQAYGRVMPFVMTAAILSGVLISSLLPATRARTLALVATSCLVAMLAITFAGNIPINRRIVRADPEHPPADWRELRRRWDRFHAARNLLNVTAFVLSVLATLASGESG